MEKIIHVKYLKSTLKENVAKLKKLQKQLFLVLICLCVALTILVLKNATLLKIIATTFITSYLAYNFCKTYLLQQTNKKITQKLNSL